MILLQTRSLEQFITHKKQPFYSSACAWYVIDGLSDPQLDPTGIVVIVIDIGEIDDIDGPTGPH